MGITMDYSLCLLCFNHSYQVKGFTRKVWRYALADFDCANELLDIIDWDSLLPHDDVNAYWAAYFLQITEICIHCKKEMVILTLLRLSQWQLSDTISFPHWVIYSLETKCMCGLCRVSAKWCVLWQELAKGCSSITVRAVPWVIIITHHISSHNTHHTGDTLRIAHMHIQSQEYRRNIDSVWRRDWAATEINLQG